jgi:hypothetical protein
MQISLMRYTAKEVFRLVLVIIIKNSTKYDLATNIFHQPRYLPISSFTKGPDHCAVPRYLHAKCCSDPEHVKNFGERNFHDEMAEDIEKVGDLLTAWLEATDTLSLLVDYRAGAEQLTLPVRDLTVDGRSIWQSSDPVHPTSALYAKLAESIFASLDELDATIKSAAPKRACLESVVVRKAGSVVNNNPSKQSWSVGILPAAGTSQSANSRGRGGSTRGEEAAAAAVGAVPGVAAARGPFSGPLDAPIKLASEKKSQKISKIVIVINKC